MSCKLLVTDDSMIIREMIKDLAIDNGWEVAGEAANGQQAVEEFARLRPDVTTLDLVMPDFDGLHALRGIRAIDEKARVLIVSAIDQREVWDEAVRLGANGFVVKPFNRIRLRDTLECLFAGQPLDRLQPPAPLIPPLALDHLSSATSKARAGTQP